MRRIKDAEKREFNIEVVWEYTSEPNPAWNRLMGLLLKSPKDGESFES